MTEHLSVLDPWSGHEMWSGDASTLGEVDDAIAAAAHAWAGWRDEAIWSRAARLRAAADSVEAGREDLIELLIASIGKPRRAARVEVNRTADMLRRCADDAAAAFQGESLRTDSVQGGEGRWSFTVREGYGVAALVTPFNAPLNLLSQKLAPALIAGNTAVVKPSVEGTPVTEAFLDLLTPHFPPDVLRVVRGGPTVVQHLVAGRRVRVVSLTGGTAAGAAVLAASGVKPVHLELGSNSPNIVLADADLERAANQIARAAFEASGQQCISAQRVLVVDEVKDELTSAIVDAASRLVVGDPREEATDLGPVVHTASARRVSAMVADAADRGAQLCLDGRRHADENERLLGPTVIADPPPGAAVMCEEAFGPVLAISSVADLTEACAVANDVPGLLQASCFTRDIESMMRAGRELWAGSVWINEATRFRLDIHPFGGTGTSGLGREGVRYALEAFSQVKHVGVAGP